MSVNGTERFFVVYRAMGRLGRAEGWSKHTVSFINIDSVCILFVLGFGQSNFSYLLINDLSMALNGFSWYNTQWGG